MTKKFKIKDSNSYYVGYDIVDDDNNKYYGGRLAQAEKLCDLLNDLYEENEELKSIKRFAERNGINVFLIDEAFRRCWNDNSKLIKENEQLKKDNEWLFKYMENQSAIIQELDSVIMAYNMEHKITIKLTEKDLKTLDKALSYYTHQKVEE